MEFEDWQFDPDTLAHAEAVSRLHLPVLLTGEVGTGHQRLARIIHSRSARRDGPFADVNGSALTEELLVEFLLGWKTATDQAKRGLIDLASGGTLFIFPLFPVSARVCDILHPLLPGANEDVVQAPRIRLMVAELIGDPEPPPWDQRHRMLEQCPWYEIQLPSLRHRPERIPELARRHLDALSTHVGLRHLEIDASACEFLQEQTWPGNQRQLANVVDRTALLSSERVLTAEEFRHSMSVS